jgi:hypothetical protein
MSLTMQRSECSEALPCAAFMVFARTVLDNVMGIGDYNRKLGLL